MIASGLDNNFIEHKKGSISDHKLVHKNLDEIFVNIESPNNNNEHKKTFCGEIHDMTLKIREKD
jgi:hypothetical protein